MKAPESAGQPVKGRIIDTEMEATTPDVDAIAMEVDRLVEEHRIESLWFLRPDYRPTTTAERIRVLRWIEQRGDLESFRKAGTLRRWLSQTSSDASADC
jgi:hypothetical protein